MPDRLAWTETAKSREAPLLTTMATCRASRPSRSRLLTTLFLLLCIALLVSPSQAFAPRAAAAPARLLKQHDSAPLFFSAQDPEGDVLSESDQTTLAVVGKIAAVTMVSVLYACQVSRKT